MVEDDVEVREECGVDVHDVVVAVVLVLVVIVV